MPYYVAPQYPELLLKVSSLSQRKARYKATQQLTNLINEGHLAVKLPNGFSTRRLIEITEKDLMSEDEDKITEAVKVLSKLSSAKQKVQELHEQALKARQSIESLFTSKRLTKEEFQNIEESLKLIKNFAQANLRYKEALPEAQEARSILDKALETPE
jgi:esterase/lipase